MSYYPTERRGGCMESISRCCRQAYVYPLDTRKLLYAGGALVGIVLIAVIWSGLSSSDSSSYTQPFKGSTVLQGTSLVVGSNFFPVNLRNLVHNNVYKVKFDQNLSKDSVFGNANCKSCQTDIPRLQSGLVGSQIWSLRVPCNAEYKDAVALTLEQVDAMTRLLTNYPENVTLIKSSNDVTEGFQMDLVGGMLSVTSGHSFDGRMSVLRSLYNLGVRVMSITSDCSTAWGAAYTDKDDSKGLTDFGAALVKEMNRLGMVIDLSEASHKTQLDVLGISQAPVVFTRAAAFGVVNNIRNIKDDVLQKLKEKKGLVMVTFAAQYLNSNASIASIDDIITHINYIKNKTGVDNVGIGAEFDADNEQFAASLSDVSTFPLLFDKLGDNNWKEDDLKKLAGQNFQRVFQEVETVRKSSQATQADETFVLQTNSACYSDYDTRSPSSVTTASPASTTSTPASTATATSPATPTPTPAKTTETPSTPAPVTTQATTTTIAPVTPTSTTVAATSPSKPA